MNFKLKSAIALAAIGMISGSALATTTSPATTTFTVQILILKSCAVSVSAPILQLGAVAGVDATAAVGSTGNDNILVTCSRTTPYSIALQSANNGSTAGLGTLNGVTGGNTDTLTYKLTQDAGGATPWGNNGVTNLLAGNGIHSTGTGVQQTFPVYATVTATTPAAVSPDTYKDTVTVNVIF